MNGAYHLLGILNVRLQERAAGTNRVDVNQMRLKQLITAIVCREDLGHQGQPVCSMITENKALHSYL